MWRDGRTFERTDGRTSIPALWGHLSVRTYSWRTFFAEGTFTQSVVWTTDIVIDHEYPGGFFRKWSIAEYLSVILSVYIASRLSHQQHRLQRCRIHSVQHPTAVATAALQHDGDAVTDTTAAVVGQWEYDHGLHVLCQTGFGFNTSCERPSDLYLSLIRHPDFCLVCHLHISYLSSRILSYLSSRLLSYLSSRLLAYLSSRFRSCLSSRLLSYLSSRLLSYLPSRLLAYLPSRLFSYLLSRLLFNLSSTSVTQTSHLSVIWTAV